MIRKRQGRMPGPSGDGAREWPGVDFAALFDAIPTPYLVMSPDLLIVAANPAYLANVGRCLDDLVGRPVFEAFPPTDDALDERGIPRIQVSFERARDTRRADTMPLQKYDIPDGSGGYVERFWSLISIPVLDAGGAVSLIVQRAEDITDFVRERDLVRGDGERLLERRIEEVQADMYTRSQELIAAVQAQEASSRQLASLTAVALQLADAETVADLAAVIYRAGLPVLGANGGAVAVRIPETDMLEVTVAATLGPAAQHVYARVPLDGPLPISIAARGGDPVLVADVAEVDAPEVAEALRIAAGSRAGAAFPLQVADRVLGSLSVTWARPHAFPPHEVELLRAFAAQCAQVLDRLQIRQAERAALERHARRHELLSRAAAALNSKLDPAAELQELSRVVVPTLADFSSVHVLAAPVAPGVMPPLPVITERVAREAIEGVALPPAVAGLSWGEGDPITEAIRQGTLLRQPIATPAIPPWADRTGSAATFRTGLNHVVLAPVIVDDLVVAVASFGMCNDRPVWSEDDLAILHEISRYAGIALGHGLTYERTRRTALVLQRSLLTEPPAIPGLQICVRYQPAGRDEVGGDWYDVFECHPDRIAVAVGDVVGHDITAAAAMGQLRAALRTLAMNPDTGPGAALDQLAMVNQRLDITPFATVLYGHLTRTGPQWSLTYSNAGHPPPILMGPAKAQVLDHVGGIALAGHISGGHTEAEVALERGSTLLLYTDGLVERRGTNIADNITELCARAQGLAQRPLDELCDELLREAPNSDDIALLAVRITDPLAAST